MSNGCGSGNEGGNQRERFLSDIQKVEALQTALKPDEEMVTSALRYVISHPAVATVIPGAKSPEQAAANAAAGAAVPDEVDVARLTGE